MRIGLVTDSIGHLPFEELLEAASALGIQTLEFGCGGWSSAPHLNLDLLLESARDRRAYSWQRPRHHRPDGLRRLALDGDRDFLRGFRRRDHGRAVHGHALAIRRALVPGGSLQAQSFLA